MAENVIDDLCLYHKFLSMARCPPNRDIIMKYTLKWYTETKQLGYI